MSAIGADSVFPARWRQTSARVEPSRSACWREAAGFRSCSPKPPGGRVCDVACVGIRYEASEELRSLCDSFELVGVAKLGRMIRAFKRAGTKRIVMAGKVTKNVIYTPWRILQLCPDLRTIQWWYRRTRADNRDDSILLSLIGEFERDGMTFASALDFCPELLVKEGILTRRAPTPSEQKDIEFGWALAKEMGRLDVGQSVAVKELATLAVEAIEGTDRCIERAGQFCRVGRLVARQGRQAPAGHAIRRTDDRRHDDRKPPQSRGQGAGDRGRQDHPARRARSPRPRRPLRPEHRRDPLKRCSSRSGSAVRSRCTVVFVLIEVRPGICRGHRGTALGKAAGLSRRAKRSRLGSGDSRLAGAAAMPHARRQSVRAVRP